MKKAEISAASAVIAPRERILAAARALFQARGLKGVSVDEIAEAAGTNKMTLYRHFQSKDLLIVEYVRLLAREAEEVWNESARRHPGDPLAQLRDWIDYVCGHLAEDRGCPIANVAVELPETDHPARAVVESHKKDQREQLVQRCREAGYIEPARIADEIFLMLEGARVNIQSVGRAGPGARFREMVKALMKGHPRKALAR